MVAALDRVGEVEYVREAARYALAVAEVELAGVRALGHDLQRRVGAAADHCHAHEIIAEALHLGLDHLRQSGDVGHALPLDTNDSRTGPVKDQPQASNDVEERAAI